MPLFDLPHEILAIIIPTVLDATPSPGAILCVCRKFYDLGARHLYTHLKFASAYQLRQFAALPIPGTVPQPRSTLLWTIAPRSFTVDLTLSASNHIPSLRNLSDALVKCGEFAHIANNRDRNQDQEAAAAWRGHGDDERDVRLKCLRLRMHSYAGDAAVDLAALEHGLREVSPDTFEWTGPDPDHHFSTAIVGPVAACLFKNSSSWRHIREVVVTSISFTTTSSDDNAGDRIPPLMTDVPSLRYLYIGQATFLKAQAIAGMFCQARMVGLEVVRLVDAYMESIWGPRLRRSDIEKGAMLCCADEQAVVIARIKRVVTCEKQTERIMGGDRVEGTHILD